MGVGGGGTGSMRRFIRQCNLVVSEGNPCSHRRESLDVFFISSFFDCVTESKQMAWGIFQYSSIEIA